MKQPIEVINFSGAKKTYEALDAEAAVDAGRGGINEAQLTTLQGDAHGFLAGPSAQDFNCVYVLGTTNYDGLRRIHAVATNYITIFAPFVAETTATGDTFRTAYKSKFPYEFLGFEAHFSAASATSESLIVARDSVKGSTFDTTIYSEDMNGLQDVVYRFNDNEAIPCDANDVIDLTWSNSNSVTWTVRFYVRSRV